MRNEWLMLRCPNCGNPLNAKTNEKDILICRCCGSEFTKEQDEYDKALKYLREKDIRESNERWMIHEVQRRESKRAGIALACMVFIMALFLYLREIGVL